MFSNLRLRQKDVSALTGNRSPFVLEMGAKAVEFSSKDRICSASFLENGKYIVSGDASGKIRYWRVEDGQEEGKPISGGSSAPKMAVSQDGKWIVTGEVDGRVTVWNAQSRKKVTAFKVPGSVDAIDVSWDGRRIVTGTSSDSTQGNVIVWSISGQQLLGPLEHNDTLAVVKFSPSGGHLIATATSSCESTRVYKSDNGHLLIDLGPIGIHTNSLFWASNGRQLFASFDDDIKFLDVFTGEMTPFELSHEFFGFKHLALASNGMFLAVCHESLVSFFDTRTHKQIGPVFPNIRPVGHMAISANNDIILGGDYKVTILRNISDILLSHYLDNPTSLQPDPNIERLENTIQQLRNELIDSQRAAEGREEALNGIIRSLRGDDRLHKTNSTSLERTIQELRIELADSQLAARQREDSMLGTIKSLREDLHSLETSSEKTIHRLRTRLADSHQKSVDLGDVVRAHELKHQCEALYSQGHAIDASMSLLELVGTLSEAVKANKFIADWLSEFTSKCIAMLEKLGDNSMGTEEHNKTLTAYSTALLLGPPSPGILLSKWANVMLLRESLNAVLDASTEFRLPTFHAYSSICDALVTGGRVREAVECLRQIPRDTEEGTSNYNERALWEKNFKRRCREALETSGDAAMESCDYDGAIDCFSNVLSLDPDNRVEILIKRSKARSLMALLEEAVCDADEAIRLAPLSHQGYETKYAALHQEKRYLEAVQAFETMLLKLERSSDAELRHRYVDARPTIRDIVNQTIRPMPRVLIDITTGCLCNKKQQVEAFKAHPVYAELVSTMTGGLDHARILREVKEFYRYVMFSHRWEDDEPLLQKVERITVYKLEVSPANAKLQSFCKLVGSFGFRWAWSDTCCVDKVNNVVYQESLVAMFSWYRSASLTLVHLLGVWSDSQEPGDLQQSIWNTRVWTFQEYVAAKIVQFYTEDWKPYLGLTMFNHKESQVVISEMEQASGISSQQLAVLSPGLDRVREKLYLASTRRTTLVEDIAYSLFGIFNVSIPVIYGEGNHAVGRLLEHILMGSGDVTILAWTGAVGTYNSCLPMDLSVYSQFLPLHAPPPIDADEMNQAAMDLRSSLPDLTLVMTLHDRIHEIPLPFMAANRLRLPGIVFLLPDLLHVSGPDPQTGFHVYHATTSTFGDIDITTADELTGIKDLYLVHPWIRPLLDQEFSCGAAALDKTTQALRIVVRLRQPFGALLFKPLSRVEYRRVAADSLIMVQVRKEAPLTDLVDNIRTIEVH